MDDFSNNGIGAVSGSTTNSDSGKPFCVPADDFVTSTSALILSSFSSTDGGDKVAGNGEKVSFCEVIFA